jgi:hypothetical protein
MGGTGGEAATPMLLVNDHRLPLAVRAAIHEENVQRCLDYVAAYRAYLGRFHARIDAARNLHEVRALGAPAPFALPRQEPGAELQGDPLVSSFARRVPRLDDTRALFKIHEKVFALRCVG